MCPRRDVGSRTAHVPRVPGSSTSCVTQTDATIRPPANRANDITSNEPLWLTTIPLEHLPLHGHILLEFSRLNCRSEAQSLVPSYDHLRELDTCSVGLPPTTPATYSECGPGQTKLSAGQPIHHQAGPRPASCHNQDHPGLIDASSPKIASRCS